MLELVGDESMATSLTWSWMSLKRRLLIRKRSE
jgi:hypothetical protein